MEILELKYKISEIKKALLDVLNRIKMTEERFRLLEEWSLRIIQSEEQRKKGMKNWKDPQGPVDNNVSCSIHVISVSKRYWLAKKDIDTPKFWRNNG